ncbi:MAG: hypothetical protein LUC47_05155 [Clostridiales bacterium]|nr:hypothetical protein [Clostridiales bacterium]
MDTVTRLCNENFTKVLGDWCRAHGVWYLGHTIEDNGAHARLGYLKTAFHQRAAV